MADNARFRHSLLDLLSPCSVSPQGRLGPVSRSRSLAADLARLGLSRPHQVVHSLQNFYRRCIHDERTRVRAHDVA
jgi:hypothetical protein